jgi:hypothetical protein
MLADRDVVKQIAAQRSLSMTGRRRDLANLPTIRQQNSAARFRHGRDKAHFSHHRSGSVRHVSEQMAEILGRYVQLG